MCHGVLCCALLCCAALFCAVLRCALLCCAVPCHVVPWCVLPLHRGLRRALPRRAVLCCAVLCCGVPGCVALHGGALCCGVLCCFVLCRALLCRGVWWVHHTSGPAGVASALVRLLALLWGMRAQVMWLAGGQGAWLGVQRLVESVVRGSGCAVRPGGSGGCPRGCPPLGPVPWSRVLWGSLSLGVCRVMWGGVVWSPRQCWIPSRPVPLPPCRPPSLVSPPCPIPPKPPVPLRLCGGPCFRRGRRLAVRVWWWVVRCSWRFPVWVYPLLPVWVYPPSPVRGLVVGGRDPMWFLRFQVRAAGARLGARAPAGWSAWCVWLALSLRGRAVSIG